MTAPTAAGEAPDGTPKCDCALCNVWPSPATHSAPDGTPEAQFRKWRFNTGWVAPFTPTGGNNDGIVYDATGKIVADCNRCEACADVVAASLNMAHAPATHSAPDVSGEAEFRSAVRVYAETVADTTLAFVEAGRTKDQIFALISRHVSYANPLRLYREKK